jgi:hypothetical protein
MIAQINRRAFITLLGSAAALPHAARAQQPPRGARIGFWTFLHSLYARARG